jgi:hypothetical protein
MGFNPQIERGGLLRNQHSGRPSAFVGEGAADSVDLGDDVLSAPPSPERLKRMVIPLARMMERFTPADRSATELMKWREFFAGAR